MTSMEIEKVPSEPKSAIGFFPSEPQFEPLKPHEMSEGKIKFRKVAVPAHPRKVELKTRSDKPDVSNLQKCADFIHAFMLGFEVIDAIALLRMDELYVDFFEIKDVKTLRGEHLSRAIGRLSGKGGKTRFAIENSTRTPNIKVARDALCSLIMGSPAGKVYSKLRDVSARLAERF
ncbi:hypothetical protein MKX01_040055 [Papaver californicum]|nr:hypothetical protein MKX01_040055 [Papaver californicum]